MKPIFIVNPMAGVKDSTDFVISEAKKSYGDSFELFVIDHENHAFEIATELKNRDEECLVYSCGGDGTLRCVAKGLYNSKCILADLPIGSGNDFIKYFGYDSAKYFTVEKIKNGNIQLVDMLSVDGELSLNIVSAGFDAEVCAMMPKFKRLKFVSGPTSYKLALLNGFFTKTKNNMGFIIDGKEYPNSNYLFAVSANAHYYGGGFNAAPRADYSDGLIDVILIPTLSKFKMISMISDYKSGKHLDGQYPFITYLHCKQIQYLSDKPLNMNIDGDMLLMKNPTITILPKSLKFMVPKI